MDLSHVAAILRIPCAIIQVLLSVSLVLIVMSQTTKSEGLTGSIGGQVTPSFKGKPGMEEQIRKYTIYISVAWFVFSIIASLLYNVATA